jgi:hypothetical protein
LNHFILARRDLPEICDAEAGAASSIARVFTIAESFHRDPQLSIAACVRNARRFAVFIACSRKEILLIRRREYRLDSLFPRITVRLPRGTGMLTQRFQGEKMPFEGEEERHQ